MQIQKTKDVTADARKRAEEIAHLFAAIDAGNSPPTDNLAIALCSYFDACLDCPDEEDGESGWKPWVVKQCNITLDAIAKAAIAYAAERVQAERERCAKVCLDHAREYGSINEQVTTKARMTDYACEKALLNAAEAIERGE